VLSEQEKSEFESHEYHARFLAKRFAAKEAFAKAVGGGLRHPVSLRRISITHDGLGKPILRFDDALRTYLEQLGISGHHLSISDERNTIIAFVVLETD
jgi:holo-[acyl-carrier protein] synthase